MEFVTPEGLRLDGRRPREVVVSFLILLLDSFSLLFESFASVPFNFYSVV